MAWPPGYTVLPFLPSGTATYGNGISGDGLVLVGEADNSDGYALAVYWTEADGLVQIGPNPESVSFDNYSWANGASNDGSVIVGVVNSDSRGRERAFRWTLGGGLVDLGELPSSTGSEAFGISSAGLTTVGFSNDSGGNLHAAKWDALGAITDLGFLPGGTTSWANAANADGSVIVGISRNGGDRAFRWTAAGGMVDIGPGVASGISSGGSVIVGGTSNTSAASRAFRWTQSTGQIDLGLLPGGSWSSAYGVSGDGLVVEGYADNASGQTRGFIWTEADGMVEMPDLAGVGSTNPYIPYGIAANGSAIAGVARVDPGAVNTAFVYGLSVITKLPWPVGYTMLAGFVGGTGTYGYGASGDGLIVVGEADDSDRNEHAVYWFNSSDGPVGPVDIGLLPGGTFAYAIDANHDGSIIVGESDNGTGGGAAGNRGFLWTELGGMVEMQTLVGGGATIANAVSDDGSVIVGTVNNSDGYIRPAKWDASGNITELPFLPGGGNVARAIDITPDGTLIVGECSVQPDDTVSHACAWPISGGVIDLGAVPTDTNGNANAVSNNGLVIAGNGFQNGINGSIWTQSGGWTLLPLISGGSYISALDISGDGNTIVGNGDDVTTNQVAYYWTQADGTVAIANPPNIDPTIYSTGQAIAKNGSAFVGYAPILSIVGYQPTVVFFSSNWYASRPPATIFSGSVTTGIISFWTYAFSNQYYFNIGDSSGALGSLQFRFNTTTIVFGANDAGTNLFSAAVSYSQVDCTQNVLISFDLSTGTVQFYVNDVAQSFTPDAPPIHGSVTITGTNQLAQWGAPVNPPPVNGYASDFWFGTTASFVDLSITSNRRKFINSDLSPVDLGNTGANPFGTAPEIYQSVRSGGVADDWKTNLGTAGGAFSDPSINGAFVDSTGTITTEGNPCSSSLYTAWVYGLSVPSVVVLNQPRVVIYF